MVSRQTLRPMESFGGTINQRAMAGAANTMGSDFAVRDDAVANDEIDDLRRA